MPVNTPDIAVRGYDVVAYFDDQAVPGDPAIASEYEGTQYYFSNPANKERFDANPAQFAPAYGGNCATAMSEGNVFGIDPTNFKVRDGRLFLFYRGTAGDTKPQWDAEEADRLRQADEHWARLNS
ncbi:MAG: YHS domain-containing protein [Chloroflexi bacterium]|nr:YHS domain-containing protein [Chloroflexota bacterium]